MSKNIDLSKLKFKEITVNLSEIARHNELVNALQRNVRKEKSYDRPDQVESIRDIGLTTPLLVFKADPKDVTNPARKYIPVQGFTRRESLEKNYNQYPNGYKFGEGKDDVRRFDSVRVRVVDTTDPTTLLLLKMDHGDYRGLGKSELFTSFEQLHLSGFTEKEIAVKLAGALEANYPPPRKIADRPSTTNEDGTPKDAVTIKKEEDKWATELHKQKKGIIQQFKLISQAPEILREVCLAKLDGVKAWPTNEELRDGMAIFEKEISEDKSGMLSKGNPGPAFKKWFDETKAIKDKAEADGSIRGKTSAMMNANQVRELLKNVTDPRLRRCIQIILRQVEQTQMPVLDKVTQATPMTAEGIAIVSSMQEARVEEPEVKETAKEEPVKEELPV